MISIYAFKNYKEYLKAVIDKNKSIRGFQGLMAKAAQCQTSYLSKALNSKIELTPDHGISISSFLNLNKFDTDYFLLLINYSRATSDCLRQHLHSQIVSMQIKFNNHTNNLVDEYTKSNSDAEVIFHSSWIYSAVQTALDIPQYRTIESLSKKFKMPEKRIENILNDLEKFGLAVKENNNWLQNENPREKLHDSELAHILHQSWHTKICEDIEAKNANSQHNLIICSLNDEDYIKIKKELQEYIKTNIVPQMLSQKKAPTHVYCFKTDFFEVGSEGK